MVQGAGIDASLNDTGVAQADLFFDKYQDIDFDKIYVSNLRRTKESVMHFIDNGVPYETLEGLKEISWGEQEGVAFTPETSTIYQQTTEKWSKGEIDAKIKGGESPVQVVERQKPAMAHILNQSNETKILICSHGRAIRILLTWLLDKPLSEMNHFPHMNTGLYVLSYENEQFSMEVFNDTSHLPSLN